MKMEEQDFIVKQVLFVKVQKRSLSIPGGQGVGLSSPTDALSPCFEKSHQMVSYLC